MRVLGRRRCTTSDPGRPLSQQAQSRLAGSQTVTRKVTAVKTGSYQTSISVPGVAATVGPSIVNFSRAGQTETITITATRDGAAFSEVAFGALKLEGAGTLARVPIAVVPQAADAPSVVTRRGDQRVGQLSDQARALRAAFDVEIN